MANKDEINCYIKLSESLLKLGKVNEISKKYKNIKNPDPHQYIKEINEALNNDIVISKKTHSSKKK